MKRDLPKYSGYEWSGVEWIGEVPSHWKTCRTKYVAKLESGHTPSRQHPEYWVDCNIPWFTLADVWQLRDGRRVFVTDTSEKVSELGLANSSARLLPANTVLLSRTASVGFSGIAACPMATTQDFVNWICGKELRPMFLLFVFRSMGQEFKRITSGSTHQTIYMHDVGKFFTPVPPLDEQDAIITFLNQETSKIDRLTVIRREQIDRLQEQRTAVIHNAITKGLDPDVQMKPSRVEWLGNIPAHWKIHRMRRATLRPVNGIWGEEEAGRDDDIICLRVADFNRQTRRINDGNKTVRRISRSKQEGRILKLGDLLLEKSGGGEQQPVGCVVLFDKSYKAITSNFVAKLTPTAQFDSRFLCYVHQALYELGVAKLSIKQTTGIQNLDAYWYLSEQAAFPDYLEQQKIADHLDYETSKIDALVTKYTSELELLEEYRASIISHAVTGKIDVRGLTEIHENALAGVL